MSKANIQITFCNFFSDTSELKLQTFIQVSEPDNLIQRYVQIITPKMGIIPVENTKMENKKLVKWKKKPEMDCRITSQDSS